MCLTNYLARLKPPCNLFLAVLYALTMETPEKACATARKLVGTVRLAKFLGITPGAVSQWKRVPPEHVIRVEQATQAQVTRYDLRPDLYPR